MSPLLILCHHVRSLSYPKFLIETREGSLGFLLTNFSPPGAFCIVYHSFLNLLRRDQGFLELEQAFEPLFDALEAGIARCNQADMEVCLIQ